MRSVAVKFPPLGIRLSDTLPPSAIAKLVADQTAHPPQTHLTNAKPHRLLHRQNTHDHLVAVVAAVARCQNFPLIDYSIKAPVSDV